MKVSRATVLLALGTCLLCFSSCHAIAVQARNSTHAALLGADFEHGLKSVEVVTPPPDYNKETYVGAFPMSVEMAFAVVFVCLVGSVPLIIGGLLGGARLTRVHIAESVALVVWLVSVIILFTNVLQFNSGHWDGSRSLTIVEAVYLLSQILTTVGYGDITPAFPRGQVWVAVNVILALCLYGSIIMECTDLISAKLQAAIDAQTELDEQAMQASERAEPGSARSKPMKQWQEDTTPVSLAPFGKSLAAFCVAASIGILFYHFYPGEGKTWLQAVYMSVITLSTVGFGWFNATTEAGKVFGAFWMLFGVATLAATISSFVEYMEHVKAKQRHNSQAEKLDFYKYVTNYAHRETSTADYGMDRYDFLKFGLVLKGVITEAEAQHIEARFDAISERGAVSLQAVHDSEAPPKDFIDKRDAAMKAASTSALSR